MFGARTTAGSALLLFVLVTAGRARAQSNGIETPTYIPYHLGVSVDEVVLSFGAVDENGLAIEDLKREDLDILDNGKAPRRIVAFDRFRNSALRIGILMDVSESMQGNLAESRAIAIQSAQIMLRQRLDEGFVTEFSGQSHLLQPWTSDPGLVSAGVLRVLPSGSSRLRGTAMFDTILDACLYEFGGVDGEQGRGILLFSDGEDNASYTSLEDAVAQCQSSNTAIYVIHFGDKAGKESTGPGKLERLASETGGRLFRYDPRDDDSQARIDADVRIIDRDLRNRYRVVYNPSDLRHDGSFHQVDLVVPARVKETLLRSGYYAPSH